MSTKGRLTILIFAGAAFTALGAFAQSSPDLHSIAPPEILQMDTLPNAGELIVNYCLIGSHICSEYTTSCHGQCCSQEEADSIGYGCSGDVYGSIPAGYHYAGWRCELYGTPTQSFPVTGPAGPEPANIKQCTNPR